MTGRQSTNDRGETYLGETGAQVAEDDKPLYSGIDPGEIPDNFADLAGATLLENVSWRPEPGDVVLGTVSDSYEGSSEFGPYPILEIDTPDGRCVMVHGFHTILQSELERRKPVAGDRIAIRYVGRQGVKAMAKYTVKVEHAQRPAVQAPAQPRQMAFGEKPF